MSDEDAFLAAIAAAPADDTPRLVYADWLDDHADPRAEYVRLEVERHRLTARDPKRPDLTARLDALRPLADHHWLPRIDRVPRLMVFQSAAACGTATPDRPLSGISWSQHHGGWNTVPYIRRGDYLYAITVRARRVHLLGRMRVRTATSLVGPPAGQTRGTEGTPYRLGRPLPPESLARLTWRSDGHEQRPTVDPDGRLASHVALMGMLALTPATAADFDALLRIRR